MGTLLILLGLFTVCHGYIQCPTCLSHDYSEVTGLSESVRNALPTKVEGYALCDTPVMMTCESNNMKCSTTKLRFSYDIDMGYEIENVVMIDRGCNDPALTCSDIETTVESMMASALEGSGMSIEVDGCNLDMCDENGAHCINTASGTDGGGYTDGDVGGISCHNCMSFDYARVTGVSWEEKRQLPTTVEGFASCDRPEMMTCATKNMKCNTASLRLSFNFDNGRRPIENVMLNEKGCSDPTTTCSDYENVFESTFNKMFADSGMTIDVDRCDLALCDENGSNCDNTHTGGGGGDGNIGSGAFSTSLYLATTLPLLCTLLI